jgi:DNA primase
MGSAISSQQIQFIASNCSDVVLLLDGNAPGRNATLEIGNQLVYRCFVRAIELPEDKQPDNYLAVEMCQMLNRAI